MSERRFTEEEARRVFAAVAERQASARAAEPGLSLAEMQEAAAASGLDPALVASVVAEMSLRGEPDETPTFLGAPLAVRQRRVLPVELDDAVWARIVSELRRAFDTPGMPTELGEQREWTSTSGTGGTPVHFAATPADGGVVVTLEQTIAKQSKGAAWLLPLSVGPLALLAAFFRFSGAAGPEVWALPGLVGGVMIVVLFALWAMWSGWARRTDRQFERVLDRIDLAARDAAQASGETRASGDRAAPEAPSLDLDALPNSPEASGKTLSPRTRA